SSTTGVVADSASGQNAPVRRGPARQDVRGSFGEAQGCELRRLLLPPGRALRPAGGSALPDLPRGSTRGPARAAAPAAPHPPPAAEPRGGQSGRLVPLQAIPSVTCDGCKASRCCVLGRTNTASIGAPCVLASLVFRSSQAGQHYLKGH